MDIATIQKRKFLNNLYRLYFSSGKKPSDFDIKNAFTKYFSVNKFNEPINIDIAPLSNSRVFDHNILNELMANTLLNMEVLFDCVLENNQEIFSIITNLNNKLDNLRTKRKELETKVDQLIFANSNSDGFFYSYLENFINLDKIDLNFTTAFIDTINGIATIPKTITETNSNNSSGLNLINSNISLSTTFNGATVVSNYSVTDFDSAIDGLNDTFWSYSYSTKTPGIVSIVLDIPILSTARISKFNGAISSISPCSIFMKAIPVDRKNGDVLRTKSSKDDYSRFSFNIPADLYTSVSLTLYKAEPDQINSNSDNPYTYLFNIRDINVSSEYYDKDAYVISSPISIPVNDNSLLEISSISIEAMHQVIDGTEIQYYVAQDNPSAIAVSDFDWIPISPSNISGSAFPSIVNLIDSPKKTETIGPQSEGIQEIFDYNLIPLMGNNLNINELNPVPIPFSEKTAYRVTRLDADNNYSQPSLLSGINCFKYYTLIGMDYENRSNFFYKSLQEWADRISNGEQYLELSSGIFENLNSVIVVPRNEISAGLIETKIYSTKSVQISQQISKSMIMGNDMNLSVYLNGSLIGDLPKGINSSVIEWSFVSGINTISVLYDKDFIGQPVIDLMVGSDITDYGTMFLNTYSYLDPINFRRKANENINVFTIDNIYGSKELLASNYISNKTLLSYYSDISNKIEAVRYRADLIRYGDPLRTPSLDSVRVKFKHNEEE